MLRVSSVAMASEVRASKARRPHPLEWDPCGKASRKALAIWTELRRASGQDRLEHVARCVVATVSVPQGHGSARKSVLVGTNDKGNASSMGSALDR